MSINNKEMITNPANRRICQSEIAFEDDELEVEELNEEFDAYCEGKSVAIGEFDGYFEGKSDGESDGYSEGAFDVITCSFWVSFVIKQLIVTTNNLTHLSRFSDVQ